MLIQEFDALVRSILPFDLVAKADVALNGLQVGRKNETLKKIAFAVDASQETFRRAVLEKADLVFVHHGLYFGRVKPVTGNLLKRIGLLIENDLALYAVHLPLDCAPDIGNNAGIAKQLKLDSLEPFGTYHGVKVGLKGVLSKPKSVQKLVDELSGNSALSASFLGFGPEEVTSVAVVSGGAPESALEAIEEGIDLFVTGERSHSIYHECLEAGLNVIFAGHYASEVFGVRALGQKIKAETDLETCFIDVPTGY